MAPLGAGWNQRPAALTEQPQPSKISRSTTTHLAGGVLTALLVARYSDKLSIIGLLPRAPLLQTLLCGLAYLLAAALGLAALHSLQQLMRATRRPEWERGLREPQRKLLGLPPLAEGRSPVPAAVAGRAASPTPHMGPPLRGGKAVITASPQEGGAEPSHRSPYGPSPGGRSGGRPSPFGDGRQVTTPQQLQRIMDEFEQETQALEAEASPAGPDYGYSPLPFSYPSSSQGGGQRGGGGTPPLPVGAAAPTYRPSAVPKGAAALPARADGKAAASTEDAKRRAMERLETTQRSIEFGIEKLREWMACHLLAPLVAAIDSAHTAVMEAATPLGGTGVQLSPLDQAIESASREADAASPAPAANKADDEVQVAQMKATLLGRLRAQAGLASGPAAAAELACLEALTRYQGLAALLRGEFPAGLLPPAPQGYIACRIRELARGPCMKSFRWNGGGSWAGKPWTVDLPTDSALALYLFAAFLAAPHWVFPQEEPSQASGNLYLGKLPSRPASEYFAILPMRPPPGQKATAVLGLQLGTDQPHFSLVLRGEAVLTSTGASALFQAICLFLRHCLLAEGGAVGGRSLRYLQLEEVVETAPPSYLYAAGQRLSKLMFNLW